MKVGLFFGSFNPIHVGHLIIANLAYQTTDLDQVWFIVSPQNPFKTSKNLAPEFDRLDMVRAAIHEEYHFQASDIEFSLPKPSYTYTTLTLLSEKYPHHSFKIIMGGDNLASFKRWRNSQEILMEYGLIVYPRPNTNPTNLDGNIQWIDAPQMDISATQIRKLVKEGKSPKFLVTDNVLEIINSRKLYL